MNEILRCLFLFSHFFLSSSFLFAPPLLPLPLARSRFTPLSLALTNLTLVELFPVFSRSLSPTHYLRARTSSPPFPLGLIHTDQGCKCDVVYHCAVPSHWGGGGYSGLPLQRGTGRICISCSWFVFLCLLYLEQPTPSTDYAAMGSETEPRSKCHVSTDGRSELHVRRKSLVCDSAGDGWTTMSD